MLVEKPGKTITRDELVTAIWHDYGGGDEGLTQAISILRKTFSDTNKELIQTVHKKGYVLNAVIRYEIDGTEEKKDDNKPKLNVQRKWLVASLAAILFCSVFIIFLKNSSKEGIKSTSIKVPYPVNIKQEELSEENATNTISTQAPDSTLYKLVMFGDQPPKFYVNNKRIAESEWEPYMSLINSLKRKLGERKKAMQ